MSFLSIFKNECPNCKKGKVFINPNFFSFLKLTEMHPKCQHCNYNFFPEIGFYWGAMFVSYGIASFQGLIVILACYLYGNELFDYRNLIIISVVIVLLFPLNLRLSRLIWLYVFGTRHYEVK